MVSEQEYELFYIWDRKKLTRNIEYFLIQTTLKVWVLNFMIIGDDGGGGLKWQDLTLFMDFLSKKQTLRENKDYSR
jgi:hypothetical protein